MCVHNRLKQQFESSQEREREGKRGKESEKREKGRERKEIEREGKREKDRLKFPS